MRSAAVVLAAGGASRYRTSGGEHHKLLAPWRGRPLLTWVLEAARAADLDHTWVVTGAIDLAGLIPPGAEVLVNRRWAEGQATSLQVALAAAREAELEAVVVGLGDQPLVPASAWRRVADGPGEVVVATYDGLRRNPVRLGRSVWDRLPTTGDEGARALLRQCPELVSEVACEGAAADIDTVEDLSRWN